MVLGSIVLDEEAECEDLVALLKAWNEATNDERHKLGGIIGKEAGRLLKIKGKSSEDIRKELAAFLKKRFPKKSRGRKR